MSVRIPFGDRGVPVPNELVSLGHKIGKLDSQREEFEAPTGLSRLVNEIRR